LYLHVILNAAAQENHTTISQSSHCILVDKKAIEVNGDDITFLEQRQYLLLRIRNHGLQNMVI